MNATRRALVVDDNAMNRRLVRAVLGQVGHIVAEAEDLVGARTELDREIPDVILLDVQLRGESGLELLAELRATARLRHVAVIAFTAFAMGGDRERFLDAGFDGHITKPIATRTFAADVEAIVQQKKGAH